MLPSRAVSAELCAHVEKCRRAPSGMAQDNSYQLFFHGVIRVVSDVLHFVQIYQVKTKKIIVRALPFIIAVIKGPSLKISFPSVFDSLFRNFPFL